MVRPKKRSTSRSSDDNTSSDGDSPPRKKIVKLEKITNDQKNLCCDDENPICKERVSKNENVQSAKSSCGKKPQRSKYEKWNCKVDTAEYFPWYRSRDLICTIRFIQKINFNDGKARSTALDRLNRISDTAPFSKYRRFPEGYYILEGDGILSKKIQQLRCVLELSANQSEKKEYCPEELCKVFRCCCRTILMEIIKGDCVYDRKKFEKVYDVTWIEVPFKAPTPPPPPPPPDPDNDDERGCPCGNKPTSSRRFCFW